MNTGLKRKVKLTTVNNLIEALKQLPPDTMIYTNGVNGYLHVGEDDHGTFVIFDDNPLEEEYDNQDTRKDTISCNNFKIDFFYFF